MSNFDLPPAACRLPPAACRLPPAACRLPPAACRLPMCCAARPLSTCAARSEGAALGVLPLPQAASRKPQAASRKPQAASRKPQAASRKPQAASRKPQAAARSQCIDASTRARSHTSRNAIPSGLDNRCGRGARALPNGVAQPATRTTDRSSHNWRRTWRRHCKRMHACERYCANDGKQDCRSRMRLDDQRYGLPPFLGPNG